MAVTVGEGLVTRACTGSVEKTLEQLEGLLRTRGITIFAVVDHSGEAAQVGLTMRPTKLLIFGRLRLPVPPPRRSGSSGTYGSLAAGAPREPAEMSVFCPCPPLPRAARAVARGMIVGEALAAPIRKADSRSPASARSRSSTML
jgi:hypothetical protein